MKKTALEQLAHWAAGLRLDDVPRRVRDQATNQVLSTLAAVYSGAESDLGQPLEQAFSPATPGPARILPSGVRTTTTQAASFMASLSMVLDFDDVMLGGHTGHSAVLVPLAIASTGGRSGADLILAQIVANEISARVNMVCAVGSTRGQMATHLHLLAAAAARAKLEKLDEQSFAAALGFALSYPGQALFPAFLGSDAKALCAALPIRCGMEAIDAVRSGLAPPCDMLDDRRGFLATHTRVPVREFLDGLGQRWHTETNSFKIYPVCGYLCSALEATLNLVVRHDVRANDVDSVDVWATAFMVGMDAHSAPYLKGPQSCISTLTFSTPFTVASAILAREFTPAQLKRSWIEDSRVWELSSRIRSRFDFDLTMRALTADIPIGAALRRTRRWQAAMFGLSVAAAVFGRGGRWRQPQTLRIMTGLAAAAGDKRPLDLQKSTKPMGARVEMRLKGGRVLRQTVEIPRGFAGAQLPEGESVRQLMIDKFRTAASPVIGVERAVKTAVQIENLERLNPIEMTRLFELACVEPRQQVRGA